VAFERDGYSHVYVDIAQPRWSGRRIPTMSPVQGGPLALVTSHAIQDVEVMTENPLIVGIDGSPESRVALRWASRLAVARGDEIIAVHALGLLESLDGQLVSADNHRSEIEHLISNDWCAPLRTQNTPFRVVVRDGEPLDVLLDMAARKPASVLVVGSRGIGAAPALALGSTSLHLVQESPVPVLVVPDPEQAARHLALRRILVAIDGSPACSPAIELACDLAARFDARVELVRAIEEVPVFPLGPATRVSMAREGESSAQARRDAEVFCLQVRDRGLPVHVTVERGNADEVVRSVAARIDADLVIAATQRQGDPSEGLLDSVSRRIMRVAHRPTLVIPVGRSAGHARRRGSHARGVARAAS
jgi:nucleotide-binding universal stress UspA family protein